MPRLFLLCMINMDIVPHLEMRQCSHPSVSTGIMSPIPEEHHDFRFSSPFIKQYAINTASTFQPR